MYRGFEEYRFDMIDIITKKYKLDGEIQSEIPNLDFYLSKTLTEQTSIMYEPSICVILQGKKAVGFGDEKMGYDTKEYLLASTHLPAVVKITQASQKHPYISLRIKFSLEEIYELLKTINPPKLSLDKNAQKGLFFGDMNIELYDCIYRLVKLLERPKEDIEFLYPLLIKKIL
jgi:hypothetical protein